MEDFTYIDKIRKIIKMRHDDIVSAMAQVGLTIWKNINIC